MEGMAETQHVDVLVFAAARRASISHGPWEKAVHHGGSEPSAQRPAS